MKLAASGLRDESTHGTSAFPPRFLLEISHRLEPNRRLTPSFIRAGGSAIWNKRAFVAREITYTAAARPRAAIRVYSALEPAISYPRVESAKYSMRTAFQTIEKYTTFS